MSILGAYSINLNSISKMSQSNHTNSNILSSIHWPSRTISSENIILCFKVLWSQAPRDFFPSLISFLIGWPPLASQARLLFLACCYWSRVDKRISVGASCFQTSSSSSYLRQLLRMQFSYHSLAFLSSPVGRQHSPACLPATRKSNMHWLVIRLLYA